MSAGAAPSASERTVVVFVHTGREESMAAGLDVCWQLTKAGITVLMTEEDLDDMRGHFGAEHIPAQLLKNTCHRREIELVLALGGDGTILRAAEFFRGGELPLLGVNLGHIGFLAETEKLALPETVERVVAGDYTVEDRMTIDVTLWHGSTKVAHTWALNEVTVEKCDRERMVDVALEVEGRPVSSFGCDGVVMATPTGSTGYAFSAGGPVIWPGVEALLMVPISAHALFARPLVVSPQSRMAVEVLDRAGVSGIMWCDGRRSWPLPPGSRVEVTRSLVPVRLARLHEIPFAARLVRKFSLPVYGWRGPAPEPEQARTQPIPVLRTKTRTAEPLPPRSRQDYGAVEALEALAGREPRNRAPGPASPEEGSAGANSS